MPCIDTACILDAAPACAGQTVPAQITRRLDHAFALLADVHAFTVQPTRRRYQRIGRLFTQVGKRASRYAELKKPRLTKACADELQSAIEAVVADTAAECVGLGFCRAG